MLRPVLSRWHPLLQDYEDKRDPGMPPVMHERGWEKAEELRKVLQNVEITLSEYARILAQVAGIPDVISEQEPESLKPKTVGT